MKTESSLDKWSWYTAPVGATDLCAHCYKPLRLHAGAHIVAWRDGKLYAVGCLLDRLVAVPPANIAPEPRDIYEFTFGARP